jgi:hypothetical protein
MPTAYVSLRPATLDERAALAERAVVLQPKSGFLPEAGCGGTKFPEFPGWGERCRATGIKATFKAKPVS